MVKVLESRNLLATFTVNATGDTGAGAGLTGDLRYCANNAASGDTINFDSSLGGKTIQLNTQIKLTNSLTIVGQTSTGTPVNVTISGQNKTRIFEIASGNDTINGLTFTAGNGTDGAGKAGNGGAILVDPGATLTLNTDIFSTNKTTGAFANAGAIENDSVLDVYGCNMSSNTSTGGGGAIYNTGNLVVDASQGGTPSVFTSNTATGPGYGGAIGSSPPNGVGQLSVSNSEFYSNSANWGGAIATYNSTTLNNDIFGANGQPNTATGNGGLGFGGAVYAYTTPPNYLNMQLNATS